MLQNVARKAVWILRKTEVNLRYMVVESRCESKHMGWVWLLTCKLKGYGVR